MPTPEPALRHPLLAAQEGIWTGQQLDPDSPAYNTAEYVCIDGPVNASVFDTALHLVVGETEALNVTFGTDDEGRPWQTGTPAGDWQMHTADFTAEPDPDAAALAWMAADMARPVDLTRGPVFGHALLRTADDRHLWYHRVHHIALDGFGLSLVARRVAQVYTALMAGEPVPDSAFGTLESVRAEERAYLDSPRPARDRAYWTGRYADRPPVATPAGRSALPARTFHRRVTDLDTTQAEALRTVARELSVTWSEVLLAATVAHLHRLTGAPEIVLSLPAMGRLGSVSLRVPAMVRNILPLRVAVRAGDSLRDLTARVSRELRAGLPHQRYRYEQLRRDLKLVGGRRRLSGPGVNIMPFEYDLRFAGHRSTVHNVSAGPVDDLAVNVYDRSDGTGVRIAVDANPELYEEAEVKAFQDGLLALLADATAAPDRPLRPVPAPVPHGGPLPVPAPVAHGVPLPAPAPVPHGGPLPAPAPVLDGGPLPVPARPVLSLIADHAARRGGAVAVEHDGDSVTYARLLGSAHDLARRLAARGVGRGDLVAVALPRGIDAVTAVLGVLLSGAAYCPLDPDAPTGRTARLLDEAAPGLVLTTARRASVFAGTPVLTPGRPDDFQGPTTSPHASTFAGTPVLPPGRPNQFQGPIPAPHASDSAGTPVLTPGRPDEFPLPAPVPPSPRSPAYVIHTSGSGGRPKGVEISHGALAHFVAGATHRYGLRSEDRVLQFAPLHFDASVEEIFLTLCAGATLVVRTEEMTESVPRFLDDCARLRVSVLDLPTAYWHELAYTLSTGTAALPEGVRAVVIGGEAALPERVERWRKAVGTSVELFNTYGPTEATVVATVADLHDPALAPGDVPIGLPLPGTRAAVVDGELYLMGDNLALGYRGSGAFGAPRFAPLAALPGAPRAYRTGDLVRIGDDGRLRFLGRADEEFKISGHRVHPAEVESALVTHPRIREAAVVGQTLPDGTRRLAAHLVTDPPAPSASEVRDHLRARLPAAMIPSAVELHDRLPRTRTGKIDRAALGTPRTPKAPTEGSRLERTIVAVWRHVLGTDDATADDDVFVLGAHSLQAIQAANRLGVELGRDIRVAWLFQHPTAAGLARFLDDRPPAATGLPAVLATDTVLDPDIRPGATRRPDALRRILLTGATGFVGVHLLAELLATTDAGIVCTVRAHTTDEALDRLHRALAEHRLALAEDVRPRITALPADLARPGLGLAPEDLSRLADTCDAIFHNAATVSIMREYGTLRAVNTGSTRDLLRLAAPRAVPLHYVSTLSVAPPVSHSPEVTETFLAPHPGLRYGYQQSKWASERLLEQAAERGLPVTVHRLGRVVGPAGTGYVNAPDFLWSVLRAGIPAGIVPHLFEDEIWTPVDHTAKSLAHLALTAAGPVFNHAAVPRVRLSDFYDWVEEYGYPLRRLPLARWRDLLPRSADVAATTLAFFDAHETSGSEAPDLRLGHIRADNFRDGLRGTGITCPPVGRDLVFRYLDHCVTTGALPSPAGRRPRPATRAK
ncbi:amino acid adenylation domain-containing protein [Streptomyces sp. 5-8]|uniref:Amino acid adenylation domain-containing protein n=1 Tax=Streptomyces musisoli TaxID=2802280 RepID=A0ABS1P2T5_9ACTN|nr:non-ribosomal peptide synthetase [Streptomyces musisoli]MBL1106681.1 amino acid adenylation domain-containing protein [Streptomyces musisoli]